MEFRIKSNEGEAGSQLQKIKNNGGSMPRNRSVEESDRYMHPGHERLEQKEGKNITNEKLRGKIKITEKEDSEEEEQKKKKKHKQGTQTTTCLWQVKILQKQKNGGQ